MTPLVVLWPVPVSIFSNKTFSTEQNVCSSSCVTILAMALVAPSRRLMILERVISAIYDLTILMSPEYPGGSCFKTQRHGIFTRAFAASSHFHPV